jgi:hypothetical protein
MLSQYEFFFITLFGTPFQDGYIASNKTFESSAGRADFSQHNYMLLFAWKS